MRTFSQHPAIGLRKYLRSRNGHSQLHALQEHKRRASLQRGRHSILLELGLAGHVRMKLYPQLHCPPLVENVLGVALAGHRVYGPLPFPKATVTCMVGCGDSMLPLSSVARLLMLNGPKAEGVHVYDQLLVPVAGCHVTPPSTETSIPATPPPP